MSDLNAKGALLALGGAVYPGRPCALEDAVVPPRRCDAREPAWPSGEGVASRARGDGWRRLDAP
jgi:hypothetical protein